MSDAEALMWNVEKDPWLNPSGASVSVVDRPIDFERFRSRIAYGAAMVPRLRDRVVPGLGRLSPPEWAPDPEFDLDYHVRHIALPSPARNGSCSTWRPSSTKIRTTGRGRCGTSS